MQRRFGAGRETVLVGACLVILLALGATGAATLAAQQGRGDLASRLAAIEREFPDLPPHEVVVTDESTWGTFRGSFRAASLALDEVAEPLQRLFEDASTADGPVADAVADASRSLLVLRQGYLTLARWEETDLEFPVEGADEQGAATSADARYGTAETGFRLVLDANERWLGAVRTLAENPALTDRQRRLFRQRREILAAFARDVRPQLRRALSLEATHELVPVERFTTSAPGMEARARSLKVVCVPEEAAGGAAPAEGDLRETARSLPSGDVTTACPAAGDGARITSSGGS